MTGSEMSLSPWREAFGRPLPLIAAIVLGCVFLLALLAPLLAPYPPNAIDLDAMLAPPSPSHLAGTDELGRDIFSRLLWGARPSLFAALAIVGIGASAGVIIGAFSGLKAGIADGVIMRIMDVMLALPGLVMALALTAVLGPSLVNAVIALGILSIPAYTRVARGAALSLRNRDYVDAARVLGAGDGHILLRHILPNVLPPLAVFMSFHLGGAILASSALSFIGLGAQPPTAEWGAMIGAGREFFLIAWWYVTIPGIAILLTALSTNIVGDALRDVLDPRR
jgi:peptide/nickel transport system permease protein